MSEEFIKFFTTNQFTDSTRTRCVVKDKFKQATASTANQEVVAAVAEVTGVSAAKEIWVLSVCAHSVNTAGYIVFKSGSAGTNLRSYAIPALATAGPNTIEPLNWSGLFRTAAGVGLFVDNNVADLANISITYIEVTP